MPTLQDYLNLITSEHSDKPNFVSTVSAFIQPFIDAQNLFLELSKAFDLDTAVGLQLDAVGQWVGRSRLVTVPLSGIYFSFDISGVGFDQGSWKGPLDASTGITSLPDDVYRLLLRAKVVLNRWDGSIDMAAMAIGEIFKSFPDTVITIQDNQDMSMTVGISGQVPAAVLVSLLQGGYLPVNPATVLVNYATTSVNDKALFGFDANNPAIRGFDFGAWNGQIGDTPGIIQSFSVGAVSQNSVTFTWVAPRTGTGPFSYIGQYRINGSTVFITAGPAVSVTTLTFSGLQADTTYDFQVYSTNGAGAGFPNVPITVRTAVGPPAQVTGLVSTGSTNTTVSLSWAIVLGSAITYQVSYRVHNTTTWINFGGPVSVTSATITGLTVNTTYDFEITSQNAVSAGTPSAILVSGTSGSLPGQVQALQVQNVTTTSFTALWTAPFTNNGPYTYGVMIAQNVAPVTYQTISPAATVVNGNFITYSFTGLVPGGDYLIQVFATNVAGNGATTTALDVPLLIPGPAQVTGLLANSQSSNAIGLVWDVAAGAVTYQPQYRLSGATTWINFGGPIAGTSVTITGLLEATTYNFQVYGINSNGTVGTPSNVVGLPTLGIVPSAVQGFASGTITSTSVALSWFVPSNGTLPFVYQTQYRINGNPTYNNFGTPIAGTSIVVTGLQSGITYDFVVIPSNSTGLGPVSTTITVGTIFVSSSTIWDANQETSGVIISNAGRTVTASSGTGIYGVKSNIPYSTGKHYVEFTLTKATTSVAVGFASLPFNFNIAGENTKILIGGGTGTITDTLGNVWLLNTSGQIRLNGSIISSISGVQEVRYTFGQVWYRSASSTWLYHDFSTGNWLPVGGQASAPPTQTSFNGNIILPGTGYGIIDAFGDVWSLSTGAQVVRNGVIDTRTSNVTEIAYSSNILWHLGSGLWWSWNHNTASWPVTGDPTGPTPIPAVSTVTGLGTDTLSVAVYPCGTLQALTMGNVILSNGNSVSVTGDTISIAFDMTNRLVWFTDAAMRSQLGAGAWNNSLISNPSTGVGGVNVSGLANGLTYELAFNDTTGTAAVTLNAGNAAFIVPLPSGYTAWDGSGVGVINVPSAPNGIIASGQTSSSITISWGASSGAPTNYQVMFRPTGSVNWFTGALVSSTSLSTTISGLLSNRSYDFYVFAYNAAGSSSGSAISTASTAVAGPNPLLFYRGLNLAGSDLNAVATVKTSFPACNAVIIPVWCSTANQFSTDVTLTTSLTSVGGWIDAAVGSGMHVFVAVYLNVRDGSSIKTILPSNVSTFFTNLQTICTQVAQLGLAHSADGMWCGVGLQPWSGIAAGDAGPFTPEHMAQWQSIYNACKAIWNSGIISYAASQTALGLASPTSANSASWLFWDAVVFNIYPGSNNAYLNETAFQSFWDNNVDPDSNTQAATGGIPLFQALDTYSQSIGQPVIVNACGIVPCDGNQLAPFNASPLPPPFDYNMQNEWWAAIFDEINKYIRSFLGFFCADGGVNGYNSPYNGINYYGVGGTLAAATINSNFSTLLGSVVTLLAPTSFTATNVTTSTIVTTWGAVVGTNIVYIAQISPHGSGNWISLPATVSTTITFSGLLAATAYDVRVFAQQGGVNGPFSAVVSATTSQAPGVGTLAARARDFTNSCAIQTRMVYQYSVGNTSPYFNTANVLACLDYLNPNGRGTGVSTIRETLLDNRPFAIFNTWGASSYKFCMVYAYSGASDLIGVTDQQTKLNTMISSGYVTWVEGPNEVDITGPLTPNGSYTSPSGGTYTGVDAVAHFQIDTWNFFKKTTVNVARYSIGSLTSGAGGNNNTVQQRLTAIGYSLNQVCNVGNVHDYTFGGYCPTDRVTKPLAVNQNWMIENQTALVSGDTTALGMQKIVSKAAIANINIGTSFGNSYVNACYYPQIYLHGFLFGSKLTSLYELFDARPDDGTADTHYGLWNVSGLPYGGAVAIHNLMQVLGDSGASAATFTTTSLNYSISNLPATADHLLLQKSNGDFALIFWPNASLFENGTYVAAPKITLSVGLGAPFPAVNVYDVLQSTQSTSIINNAAWIVNTPVITPVQILNAVSTVSPVMGDGPIIVTISSTASSGTLASPTNIQAITITQTSAIFSWTATAGTGITYVPQYSLHGANNWTALSAQAGTTATITGLTGGTSYDFDVYALQTGGGQSNPSVPINFTTNALASESPDQTHITISGGGSITDSWGQVWTISAGGQVVKNGVVDPVTGAVTEEAYVNHVFWQFGSNLWWSWNQTTAGGGVWSSPGTATSPLTSTAVAAPTNVQVTSVTNTSGVITWTAVPGTGITYVAQSSIRGLNTWTSLPATAATTATFTGLTLGTSYDIRVQATQGTLSSAYSALATLTTSGSTGTVTGVPLGTTTSGNLNRMFKFWRMAGLENHYGDPATSGSGNAYQSTTKIKAILAFMNPSGAGNGGPFIVRDDTSGNLAGTQELGSLGYRLCLYFRHGGTNSWTSMNNQGPNMLSLTASGYVAFVEGPNEYVNFNLTNYTSLAGTSYSGQGDSALRWQIDLYNQLHPKTNCFGEPMQVIVTSYGTGGSFGSTPIFTSASAAGITLSNFADLNNVHSYMNWAWPYGASGGSGGGTPQLDVEANANSNGPGFTTKPKAGTEIGIQHELFDANKWGTRHTYALLAPQMWLDCFKRGWSYSALYELADRNTLGNATTSAPGSSYEDVWGLCDIAGLPYEAAVVIRWMAGLTVDTGANKGSFFTGNLTVTVSNLGAWGDHRWFQKSDGTVVGMIWDNAPVYSHSGSSPGSPITVSVKTCTVTLSQTCETINVYEPNVGAATYVGANWVNCPVTPTATKTVTRVNNFQVNMSDHIVMVVIAP